MSTPTYSKKEIERILRKNGWVYTRHRGSHQIYMNDKGEHMSIVYPICNKILFQKLMKKHKMEV